VRLVAGEIEIEGLVNLDDFAAETGIQLEQGPYETLGGYVMAALGHLPETGERVERPRCTLIVTEMDGRRIARVRVIRKVFPEPQSLMVAGDQPDSDAGRP
jgi:putative hemolysin